MEGGGRAGGVVRLGGGRLCRCAGWTVSRETRVCHGATERHCEPIERERISMSRCSPAEWRPAVGSLKRVPDSSLAPLLPHRDDQVRTQRHPGRAQAAEERFRTVSQLAGLQRRRGEKNKPRKDKFAMQNKIIFKIFPSIALSSSLYYTALQPEGKNSSRCAKQATSKC